MTYFEARRVEQLFKDYRQLATSYWDAAERIAHGPLSPRPRASRRDTDASRLLRQQIVTMEPEIVMWARSLGVGVEGQSYPAPAVGGPVLPFNLLACVIDQEVGHSSVSTDDVLDSIDKCIGAAQVVKRRVLSRLIRPWCWLVDGPALLVAWPFEVLRRAGVPKTLIESTGAQVVKVLMTALLWAALFGWLVYTVGLPEAIKATLEKAIGKP